MPFSYEYFKTHVKRHVINNFSEKLHMLDVGAGCGTYGRMFRDHYPIDALEIFADYIKKYNLESIYNNVYVGDILNFDFSPYDYIIMGDVLEHIQTDQAQELMQRMHDQGKMILVAVPYNYEQGEVYGNIYETHHQPDLTVDIMYQRYPMLRLIHGNSKYGYFVNYIPHKK